MLGTKSLIVALMVFFTVAIAIPHAAFAGEVRASWQDEWDRTVKAAEQEGQVVLYSLSEIGDAIANTSFQKKFPKIKISVVTARGGEHVSRLMAERRAGKFLADLGNLGNTSPYTLYQSKTLDPIASALFCLRSRTSLSGGRESSTSSIQRTGTFLSMSARRFSW
jgi:hypothetical protein